MILSFGFRTRPSLTVPAPASFNPDLLRNADQPVSFADLQPIQSTFPSTSPLAAGQRHPATAQVGLVAAFFSDPICVQSWDGRKGAS